MRALGFQAHYPAEAISVAGLTEVVFALPRLIRMLRGLVELAVERQPDLIVLIDLPDFNLRLAKRLKRRGFKVVYYISPSSGLGVKNGLNSYDATLTGCWLFFPF